MEQLTFSEMRFAADVGVRRQLTARQQGRQHRHGYEGDDYWGMNIEAAAAEMLVAKWLRRYWVPGPVPDKRTGDVAGHGVRWTPRPDGCLILHADDPPEQCAILVTGRWPEMLIRGWLPTLEGQQAEFWATAVRWPCFMVPQHRLRALVELPDSASMEGVV